MNGATLGIVLVIDDSGSMSGNDPEFLRLAAARLAIDQLPNQDVISVVKFDHGAYSVVEPTELTGANRGGLKQAVDDSPFFSGGTEYAPAFVQAKAHLAAMNPANKAVIFLSDGSPGDAGQEEHLSLGVPVFTVGLGPAPGDILTAIADQTGGTYRAAQDAAAVQGAFSAIVSALRCESAAGVFDDTLRPGEVAEHPIAVPADAAELRATATWSLGQFRVDLIEPSGVSYGPGQSYPAGIAYTEGGSYVTFGAQNPSAGGWRIRIEALPGTPPDGVRVTSQITFRSGRTTAPPPVGPPSVPGAAQPTAQPSEPQAPSGTIRGRLAGGDYVTVKGESFWTILIEGYKAADPCGGRPEVLTSRWAAFGDAFLCVFSGKVFFDNDEKGKAQAICIVNIGANVIPIGKLKVLGTIGKKLARFGDEGRGAATALRGVPLSRAERQLLNQIDASATVATLVAKRDWLGALNRILQSRTAALKLQRLLRTNGSLKAAQRLKTVQGASSDIFSALTAIEDTAACLKAFGR